MPLQVTFPIMKTPNEVRSLRIIHSSSNIVNVYIPTLYRHSGKTGSDEIKVVQIVNIPRAFAHSGDLVLFMEEFFSFLDDRCQGAIECRNPQTISKRQKKGRVIRGDILTRTP